MSTRENITAWLRSPAAHLTAVNAIVSDPKIETEAARAKAVCAALADAIVHPIISVEDKLAWLYERACTVHIDFNDHRSGHMTVEEMILNYDLDADDFGDEAEMRRCIEANRCVKVQCYPSTPVGSFVHYACDLAAAVEVVYQAARRELTSVNVCPSCGWSLFKQPPGKTKCIKCGASFEGMASIIADHVNST